MGVAILCGALLFPLKRIGDSFLSVSGLIHTALYLGGYGVIFTSLYLTIIKVTRSISVEEWKFIQRWIRLLPLREMFAKEGI